MTIQQPEALRLADQLDLYATGDAHQQDIEQAADELRRLHDVKDELLAALKWAAQSAYAMADAMLEARAKGL